MHEKILGDVLVTRSPCVHPGDIRKLKAVDREELSDLVNVIVFSSMGDRPDQNKMGSGDLDGDLYWVNWNPMLVKNYREAEPDGADIEEEPAFDDVIGVGNLFELNQAPKDQISEDENDNRIKCIDNFANYIKNDILGQVANLHIKIADMKRKNVYSENCKTLSKMHCQAVDGQKHDTEIDVNKFYKIRSKFKDIPDFMAEDKPLRNNQRIYKSPGVLGQMYRNLRFQIDIEEIVEFEYALRIRREYKLERSLFVNFNKISIHLAPVYENIVRP